MNKNVVEKIVKMLFSILYIFLNNWHMFVASLNKKYSIGIGDCVGPIEIGDLK